jgi:hypothetical protein
LIYPASNIVLLEYAKIAIVINRKIRKRTGKKRIYFIYIKYLIYIQAKLHAFFRKTVRSFRRVAAAHTKSGTSFILTMCHLNYKGSGLQFKPAGRAFLNHISLLYYYGLMNALRNAGLTDKYSAEDVLKLTKNIYRVDIGDNQGIKVSAIQKKTKNVFDTLGVDLLRKIRDYSVSNTISHVVHYINIMQHPIRDAPRF